MHRSTPPIAGPRRGAFCDVAPRPSRRALLLGLGLSPVAAMAAASDDCVEVAAGLWVLPGRIEEASAANLNAIANTGFVAGASATAVIDPGGSLAHGRQLRRAIEARGVPPVRHVILTHGHPDHVMGATAFADLRPEVIGHARLPEFLAQRGAFYADLLRRELGAAAEGSGPLPPTRLVMEEDRLDLGGRVLALRAHPPAHTDNDLSLLDHATGTLWLSDLLFAGHIPTLDGDLHGWLRVLDTLSGIPAPRAVPGHGPAALPWPAAARAERDYLTALRDETRAALRAGIGLAEAPGRVATAQAAQWRLAELHHGRNVTAAYRQLEWE
ncbi:quinoprotein relay system zinc metallohydrolase 2 [Teichococcus oryzae]|uniref:Quinoprotein relay system zinc metallohydrolase 2 n=1 Tax=Teichococcus oryzae TaxID=1608942 RepID=A0A5B2TGA2_9PROT|nr:quinoprotein relay system zinc metallohydrolase 2 [Pseudoroseomonas oryzae]KAA2213497.1 quinoprotein relay system zinc metallohydrolase 2 [Pseudoroseomonas oryzae]